MTRSVIPLLRQMGVEAITVGVNGGSAPPAVPSVFVWSDTVNDIIAMWHPGGYGGIEISDCVIVPGFPHALAFAYGYVTRMLSVSGEVNSASGDNAGPPDIDSVAKTFTQLRGEFPNANVTASTYDEFVSYLLQVKDQLPVYTQEIGDTWIYVSTKIKTQN